MRSRSLSPIIGPLPSLVAIVGLTDLTARGAEEGER